MILGLHCGVMKGYDAALETAKRHGCAVMQMLPYRRHHDPAPDDLKTFRSAREAAKIRLLAHSRFVPSLASSDEARRRRSVELLARELALSDGLGAEGYVLHAGAFSPDASAEDGIKLCAESIAAAKPRLPILIENVPGGGRRLGGSLEELRLLIESARRAGVDAHACLDTAHAWSAGYDLSSADSALKFLARVHRVLGADNVRAFHLNDSRALLGSRVENHASWGTGHLRPEALDALLGRDEYSQAFGILEPPPGEEEEAWTALMRSSSR
jgi:deoxyribonuclease-4